MRREKVSLVGGVEAVGMVVLEREEGPLANSEILAIESPIVAIVVVHFIGQDLGVTYMSTVHGRCCRRRVDEVDESV